MSHDEFRNQTARLLVRCAQDDRQAAAELHDLLHDELHGMARRFMADQRGNHTLQATALVNEAWMRVAGAGISAESRAHFLAVAARAMRSVLVDHARRRTADRRGGGAAAVPLEDAAPEAVATDSSALLDLEETLQRLARRDPSAARVAEMRIFGGMEHAESAQALGVSVKTIERWWRSAREALQEALQGAPQEETVDEDE